MGYLFYLDTWACPDFLMINILKLICKEAAAMQTLVASTVELAASVLLLQLLLLHLIFIS